MKQPPTSTGYWFVLNAFHKGTIHIYFASMEHSKEVYQMLIDNKYDADIKYSPNGPLGVDEMEIIIKGHFN